jgi:hypothetical protein
MENKKNFVDFTSYENYKHQIEIWYRAYNISREKMELFHDFLISLNELVENTYLGSDVILTDDDIKGHFNWCWDKNINNFKNEVFLFENQKLYEYFLEYSIQVFYSVEKNIDYSDKNSLIFWNELFDYSKNKTNSEIDTFIEIYKIIEKAQKTL